MIYIFLLVFPGHSTSDGVVCCAVLFLIPFILFVVKDSGICFQMVYCCCVFSAVMNIFIMKINGKLLGS